MPSVVPSNDIESWKTMNVRKWGFSDFHCKNLHYEKLAGFKQTFLLRTARKIR